MTRQSALAFVVSLALAVLHSWPLASDLSGLSRHDNADTTLNTWAVNWVAHALTHEPRHLVDAPIFHPEPRALAYSEPLIVPGVMAIPLRSAGLDATSTYNLLALLGYALSAWAMWRLVAAWTNDEAAGALAGLAYAFNAHLLTRFGHLQAVHAEAVPLVLYAVDRLVSQPRWRDGLWLGLGLALVGLTSIYQLAFVTAAVIAAYVARLPEWRRRAVTTAGPTGLGLGLGILLVAPLLWQYLAVSRDSGLTRTLADAAAYAATWRDYLATAGRLHYAIWSAPFFDGSAALFPGVTVSLLALVGLAAPAAQHGRVVMMGAIGAVGVLMSLGPVVPGYAWLFDHVPLLQATRATDRWGVLALTALAVIAAIGLARLRQRMTPRAGHWLAATVLLLVTVEAIRAPIAYTPTPAIPAVYRHLAASPGAVLLEYPTYGPRDFHLNAPYLLAQTTHFRPIVAGYSGFSTPGYAARLADLATFPAERAHQRIRALGVTHVVLHLAPLRLAVGAAAVDAIDRVPWLERSYEDEVARVYRVRAGDP